MSNEAPSQAVVLAGGRASRMLPLTRDLPKCLLPVGGRPFLEWPLRGLRAQGIDRVHLCLGYQSAMVEHWLRTAPVPGLNIAWTSETSPLGTGGALQFAVPHLDKRVAVLFGDSYSEVRLGPLWRRWSESHTDAGMVVLRNDNRWVPSNVTIGDGLVTGYRKHGLIPGVEHVDFGVLFLETRCLKKPRSGSWDLADLFHALIRRRQLAALEITQRFYEIGSPDGYREMQTLADTGKLLPAHISVPQGECS